MRRHQALPSQAAQAMAPLVYGPTADLGALSSLLAAQPFHTRLYSDITKRV